MLSSITYDQTSLPFLQSPSLLLLLLLLQKQHQLLLQKQHLLLLQKQKHQKQRRQWSPLT